MTNRLSDTQLKDLISANVTEAETILAQLQTLIGRHHKVQTELLARLAPLPPMSEPRPVPEPVPDPTPSPDPAPLPQTDPIPQTTLGGDAVLVISVAGQESFLFRESDASDLGLFSRLDVSVSARVLRKDLYTVQFNRRTYASTNDLEVIVTYGWPTSDPTTVQAAPNYQVKLTDGEQAWEGSITGQSWMQDIRVYGEPIDLNLPLPDFFPTLSTDFQDQLDKYVPAMDHPLGGLTAAMPTTGERREIGVITEDLAVYALTQNEDARAAVIKQVQAMDAWPMHVQEAPGVPFKIVRGETSWKATMHANHAYWDSYIAPSETPAFEHEGRTYKLKIDTAHYPAVYWAYAITGDPYYLRQLHYRLVRGPIGAEYTRATTGLNVIVGQTRAYAWWLRDIFLALMLTPDETPDWLLPKDYIRGLLDDALAWVDHLKTIDEPWSRVFRLSRGPSSRVYGASWQHDFLIATLGLMIENGFEQARPALEWFSAQLDARTNGVSGWKKQWAFPYNWEGIPGAATTWSELSDEYAAAYEPYANVDQNTEEFQGHSLTHLSFGRAALVQLDKLGYAFSATRQWADDQFIQNTRGVKGKRHAKWAWV